MSRRPSRRLGGAAARSSSPPWPSGSSPCFLVVVFAVSKVGGSDTADTPLLDQAAPPITGQQLDGGAFDLSTRRGSWVVLNFFASWCAPCKQEAAELVRFATAQQSAGTAGAELVGIVYNDSADAMRSFLQTYGGGNCPVVLDQQGSYASPTAS